MKMLVTVRGMNAAADYKMELDIMATEQSNRPTFAGVDPIELAKYADKPIDWLVRDVFSADQPTAFGARSKCLKTTTLIDLVVSLATGTKWLGEFEVPKQKKVLFITGESNTAATARRMQKACRARMRDLNDLDGFVRVEAEAFPELATQLHLDCLQRTIENYEIDVLIVDPVYRGMQGVESSQLNRVGDVLVKFARNMAPAAVVFSAHFNKAAASRLGEVPALEDFTGAGIHESCGNWFLIGRNEPYAFDRLHDLSFNWGGRDEQCGHRRMLFNEEDWTCEMMCMREYQQEKEDIHRREEENRKVKAQNKQRTAARKGILKAFRARQGTLNRSELYELSGQPKPKAAFEYVLGELLREGTVIEKKVGKAKVLTADLKKFVS